MSSVFKLFVGQIPPSVKESELREAISKDLGVRINGSDCKLISKKDKNSFAFLTVNSKDDNEKLLDKKFRCEGTELTIRKSISRNKQAFLSLTDENVTDIDLIDALKGLEVSRLTVFLNRRGTRNAIVRFKDSVASEKFFDAHRSGIAVKGNTVRVRAYKPQVPSGSGPRRS